MSRSTVLLVLSVGLALAASASPLAAQKSETIARRTPRASTSDSSEVQLRRLERSIDSLVRIFDSEELSPDRRLQLRQQIDSRFAEFNALRMATLRRPADVNVFTRTPDGAFGMQYADASTFFPRIAQGMVPGWIGIIVSGAPTQVRVENNEMFMRYLMYPQIASVDPSSPAQRAGLTPGDTLMAYNGRDVRAEEISMTRLLVPKATVKIRVRREGKVKELPVVVAEPPARIKLRRAEEFRDAGGTWVAVTPPVPPLRSPAPAPVFPPQPPRAYPAPPARSVYGTTPVVAALPPVITLGGVAGAQVVTVSESMKRSLGLPAGVLVTTVPVGSPADESGLEEGDVILRVNQQPVTVVHELRDLIQRAVAEGESSAVVELRRGKDRRTLRLRWN